MNFKFGQYIQRVHPKKSPLNFFGEKGAWAYPGTVQFFQVLPIISGTGKATDIKLCQYIQRVHPNKSPLNILVLEKRERGHIQGLPNFIRIPPIISGRGKATNFKCCMHIYRLNRNKSPLNILRKVAMGVVRDPQQFSGHPYIRAHRAVIFAIAQLSCCIDYCSNPATGCYTK